MNNRRNKNYKKKDNIQNLKLKINIYNKIFKS